MPESIVHGLKGQGLEMDVLTGVPNYPSGRVADGYSAKRASVEDRQGVRVRRTPLFPSHNSSPMKRMANYLSWAVSSTLWGQGALRRSDAALVYSSPATAALPAMVSRVLWRKPYVLLLQDVWPDSIFASGFLGGRSSRAVFKLVDGFVRRTYAMADHIAVISPGMVDLLVDRGVSRNKVTVVYNWLPESEPVEVVGREPIREELGLPGGTRLFLYAGNHGRAQALEGLIDAFTDPATAPAHLVLLGDGVSKPDLVRRSADSSRIHFLDPVPYPEAIRIGAEADVHVVALADEPLFAVTMPSKLQSALASGSPALVVAPGDSADIVTKHGAGFAARPGDAASIASAVNEFNALDHTSLSAMGARGREAYERLMARDIGAGRLAELLRRAATRRRTKGADAVTSTDTEKEKP
ncbi:glycosyltransferase family 4 protein [Nocardioides abyssi]|uniref:Glycosyltransferase family 4 protein n=1 Tax=Nocardioides abyssi TaxID=3058370 RepID=A0ABT8EYN5_9ACTN|nr:glycosyltransferase family 4 protein [Nocardioides abyssi]MDN4163305.1 glycosyltransferase family 4 protein [Nocardioides abyssi]